MACLVARWLRALDSSSGASDHWSVGLSPGSGTTCVAEQDTLPFLHCPSDGT